MNRVEITGAAPNLTLKINGYSMAASAAALELDAGSLPVLTLRLPVVDGVLVYVDGVAASLVCETREALMSMGWTPPVDVAT